jgi:hypothetical protein
MLRYRLSNSRHEPAFGSVGGNEWGGGVFHSHYFSLSVAKGVSRGVYGSEYVKKNRQSQAAPSVGWSGGKALAEDAHFF